MQIVKPSFFAILFILLLSFCYGENQTSSIFNSYNNNTRDNQAEDILEDETTDFSQKPKILKLDILSDLDELQKSTLYVGQYITIEYSLLLFDNAKIVYTEFKPSVESDKKNNISIVEEGAWERDGDYYKISYTFKILNTKAVIPSLVVHVQNRSFQDSMQTSSIALEAQDLKSNKDYCGVVASSMKIIDYTLESYDDKSNMILIELEASNANLEDFKLPHVKDQEFGQGARFGRDISRVNVIARIPKNLSEISFEYFDTNKRDYIPLHIANVVEKVDFEEENRGDLNPKNSFLKLSNVAILVVLLVCIMLTLFKRSYFFAILSFALVAFLIYRIFANTYSIRTLPNAKVLIQPTRHSTELFTITNPTKLEAIDSKNNYFKVNIDSKVGWISKDDTNKK